VFYVADFHAKREALRLGLGLGWMPRRLVDDDLDRGVLGEIPFAEGSRRRFTPWFVRRTDRPLGRAARRLRELVLAGWPPTDARA
jgi:DNA-binding transcriptional LysR family regulator